MLYLGFRYPKWSIEMEKGLKNQIWIFLFCCLNGHFLNQKCPQCNDMRIYALPETHLQHLRQALYFLTFPWVIRGKTQLGYVVIG